MSWRNVSFRGYAGHRTTDEHARGVGRLLDAAAGRRSVSPCSEAVLWRYHHALVAADPKAFGVPILHIMALGKAS